MSPVAAAPETPPTKAPALPIYFPASPPTIPPAMLVKPPKRPPAIPKIAGSKAGVAAGLAT